MRLRSFKSFRHVKSKAIQDQQTVRHDLERLHQETAGENQDSSKSQGFLGIVVGIIVILCFDFSARYSGYYRAQTGNTNNHDPYLLYFNRIEHPAQLIQTNNGWSWQVWARSMALTAAQSLKSWFVTTNTAIVYRPLKARGEIRVLLVAPGKGSEKVRCELLHIRLPDNKILYEAVSYVWGSQDKTESITVGVNEDVPIGVNLHEALKALRLPDKVRFLWVDKLCINQDDVTERTQQVRVMGRIYSTAKRVLIWIGRNEDGTQGSLRAVSTMIQQLRKHLADAHRLDWQPVVQVLRREWFQRMWMVQELAQAHEAIVVFGDETENWDDIFQPLASAILSFDYHALPDKTLESISNLLILDGIRARFKEKLHNRYTLAELISLTRHFKATDPRDKIFALVGLAGDVRSSDWEVSADYSTSVADVFKRFACWQISRQKSLDAFSFSTHASTHDLPSPSLPSIWSWFSMQYPTSKPLPSWAPDLTKPDSSAVLPKLSALHPMVVRIVWDNATDFTRAVRSLWERTQAFHADFAPILGFSTRSKCHPPAAAFSDGTNVIHLRGLAVGEITLLSMTPSEAQAQLAEREKRRSHESESDVSWLVSRLKWLFQFREKNERTEEPVSPVSWMCDSREWLSQCHHMALQHAQGEEGASRFDAFWRTMLCDMTPDFKIAPQAFSQSFSETINLISKLTHSTSSAELDITATYNALKTACAPIAPSLRHWSQGRRFAIARDHLASVPDAARVGDLICIFVGGRVPVIVRPRADGYFELIGECFVHGIMHGRIDGSDIKTFDLTSFALK